MSARFQSYLSPLNGLAEILKGCKLRGLDDARQEAAAITFEGVAKP
jgi:hypothetical protein